MQKLRALQKDYRSMQNLQMHYDIENKIRKCNMSIRKVGRQQLGDLK